MSRKIKFRGKQLHSEIWIYGDLTTVTPYVIDRFITFFTEDGSINRLPVDPSTVGQYTGLRDKNGKAEAFEGDIVRENRSTGVIKFADGRFYIDWIINKDFFSDTIGVHLKYAEIIGNIYDNPELLNSQKQKLEDKAE